MKRHRTGMKTLLRTLAASLLALPLLAQAAPLEVLSRPGIDAPELAALGSHAVGVRSLQFVDKAQLDLTRIDPKTGAPHVFA